MRRPETQVQVEVYRGNQIVLDKLTSKFLVEEIVNVAPCDTIKAARNAIDRYIADANKGVRRKILALKRRSFDDDQPRVLHQGELTSWSRNRAYRGIEGVCMFGRDRQSLSQADIFEDTPRNRALIARVTELDKAAIKAKHEAERIVEKELQRAALPPTVEAAEKE